MLKGVFEEDKGFTVELKRLEFDAPFGPFFHRWDKFCEVRDSEEDANTRVHLDLLWEALEKELRPTLAIQKDLLENGVIT